MLKSTFASLSMLALLMALAGCRHNVPAAKTTPPAPAAQPAAPVASLTVSPENVQAGQSAQLSWNTQNASSITIDGVGTVAASGSKTISPSTSTTYHLMAKGDGGSAEASARLTVTPMVSKKDDVTEEELFRRTVKDIFFSYDNADIRKDEDALVQTDAQFLGAHPSMRLVIEGHCDERGSEDYNMVLGQSRASRVREALIKQGISGDRIKLISLGKEKPFCTAAENESCWSQNRRAHFVLENKQQASAN
jgi:peptidoglycan-associated lipoprotein